MNTFDSITIEFDSSAIIATPNTSINPYVKSVRQIDKNGCVQVLTDEYGLSSHGVSYIKSKNILTQMAFSAKVLKDKYPSGLSINTIEEAICNINEVASFKFNSNKLIDTATIKKVDSTQMVYPSYGLNLCCDSLMSINTNHKCKVTRYKGKNNLGIEFNASIKSEKRRLIMYSKELLLLTGGKKVNAFLKNCKNPKKVIEACKGSLRVEQGHTSFKSLRNRFKAIDNKLLSIFSSVQNVNYDYMVNVQRDSKQMDMFLDAYKDMSLQNIIELKGMEQICLQFDCDIDMIKTFIETKYISRTSVYKALDKFKRVVALLKVEQMPQLAQSEQINNHIIKLIKDCA